MQRTLLLKPWPLKFWLLLLVAAVVVPLSTLTGFVVWQARDSVRARAEDQLLHQARANAIVVDAEFQRVETGLRALAASSALARGDMGAVEAEMRSMARHLGDAPIGLAAADGREVLCTLWPPGERRPDAALRPELVPLVASRGAKIGDLSPLPTAGGPAAAVVVPVEAPPRGEEDGARLSFYAALPGGRLSALLTAVGDGAVVAVADRAGSIAARTRNEAAFLGRRLALPLADDGRSEGVLHTPADGGGRGRGAESLAFARAPRSGYTVAIAVPQAVFQAPLGGAVLHVVALAGAFLLIGGGLAAILARRFRQELRRATRAGAPAPSVVLREADELGRSVAEEAAARDRRAGRERAPVPRAGRSRRARHLAQRRRGRDAGGRRLGRAHRPNQGGNPWERLAVGGPPRRPRRHGGRLVGGAGGGAAGGD